MGSTWASRPHSFHLSSQLIQGLEEVGEGLTAALWVFDGEPRLAVANQVEAAEDAETHREAVVFVSVDLDQLPRVTCLHCTGA